MVFSVFLCGTIGKFEAEDIWQWVSIYAGEATTNDPSSDNERGEDWCREDNEMRCAFWIDF
jgi:hypothetical protein